MLEAKGKTTSIISSRFIINYEKKSFETELKFKKKTQMLFRTTGFEPIIIASETIVIPISPYHAFFNPVGLKKTGRAGVEPTIIALEATVIPFNYPSLTLNF